MLKHRLVLFAIIAFFVGTSLPAAAEVWRASVPFDFVVQGVTFPAGTYDVIASSSPRVVIVRNEANLKQSFMIVLPTGESLVNGNARIPLQPKSPAAPFKVTLRDSQR